MSPYSEHVLWVSLSLYGQGLREVCWRKWVSLTYKRPRDYGLCVISYGDLWLFGSSRGQRSPVPGSYAYGSIWWRHDTKTLRYLLLVKGIHWSFGTPAHKRLVMLTHFLSCLRNNSQASSWSIIVNGLSAQLWRWRGLLVVQLGQLSLEGCRGILLYGRGREIVPFPNGTHSKALPHGGRWRA